MANGTIATRTGTMLVPGVSLNRRLYTKELITKAVNRMQDRIGSPNGLPIVMRTHHEAGDDSTRIVGKITGVTVDDQGIARYESALYDTPEGRTIASLTDPKNPALKSTSIHGYWLGPVRRISHENKTVETGDDLEIDAVDFTASPGVLQAVMDGGSDRTTESATARTPISESFDVTATAPNPGADEASDPKKPYGDVPYADPGYQKDGKKRYALDTKARIKAAWSYINQKDNAAKYTAGQLAKIKARIKAAAKKVGIDISSDENWLIHHGPVEEFYGDDGMASAGRFCVSLSNGALDIVISSYCVDPADLDVIARKAMDGACQALAGMDPDADGDIDVPGMVGDSATTETTITIDGTVWTHDQIMEAVRNHVKLRKGALTLNEMRAELGQEPIQTSPASGADTTESTGQEPTVSEATNEATTTAAPAQETATRTLTDGDVAAIGAAFGAALKEHQPTSPAPASAPATETAPQAPATESTTKVTEAQELKEAVVSVLKEAMETVRGEVAHAVTTETNKVRDELREALVKAGFSPSRVGFRAAESTTGDAPERTPADLYADRANVLLGNWAKTPVPHAGTGIASAPTAPVPAATQ